MRANRQAVEFDQQLAILPTLPREWPVISFAVFPVGSEALDPCTSLRSQEPTAVLLKYNWLLVYE